MNNGNGFNHSFLFQCVFTVERFHITIIIRQQKPMKTNKFRCCVRIYGAHGSLLLRLTCTCGNCCKF